MEGTPDEDPFPDDPTGLLESLRRLDNYADEILEEQGDANVLLQQQVSGMERLLEEVTGDTDVDLSPDRSTYLFNMSKEVPADTSENEPVTEVREIDYDGVIREIRVVSVEAAQQAVGARFGFSSGEQIMPRDDPQDARYIPLAGDPVATEPNVEVDEGEEVVFSFANNDVDNSHFVTATIQVEERSA